MKTIKAKTLARVYTHTYSLVNEKINIEKIAIKPINKQVFVAIFLCIKLYVKFQYISFKCIKIKNGEEKRK